jgi:hypothetical protein
MLKGITKEERKVKRTQFAKERVQRKRFQGQTLLEQETVSERVAIDYQHRYNEFLVFVKVLKLSIRGLTNLDSAFAEFLNHMFLELYVSRRYERRRCLKDDGRGTRQPTQNVAARQPSFAP